MSEIHINRLSESILRKMLENKEVKIILGARQVGKTTLIKRVLPVSDTKILNLDNQSDIALLNSVKALSPKEAIVRLGSPMYLVIDEAQRQPEIGRLVKGWYDSDLPVKFVISGSSSLNIVDQSAEPLTGRNEKLELPPLLFTEILKSQEWFQDNIKSEELNGAFLEQTQALLIQHMVFGFYPASIFHNEKDLYLRNIAADYLVKDILQLASVREPEKVKLLLLVLAHQSGNLVNVSKLGRDVGLEQRTVEKYLDLLEASYIIFRLNPFSRNSNKELFRTPKIYFWDTGIRNALINNFSLSPYRSDIGPLFENFVIAEFKKIDLMHGNQYKFNFWQNNNQSEVDLVLSSGEKMWAYEMKWSDGRKTGRAFTNEYGVRVDTINKEIAPKLFYQLDKNNR